ncbi:hypothetical protein CNMCM5793_007362 [Aspergillus hiratsukae]|uniref:Uncharacterized protein n=1 Tax=Aspergillus hiratsukae TaxID=1194566 RepID=A0A8H6P648_9EURO|nr:hypothetical protein CNMCM5793_007362 [Aspergillus hiratsukae]KAF7160057.1 hypothetical protein CNMCM6106_007448 [Aspergillus hiratsukae]
MESTGLRGLTRRLLPEPLARQSQTAQHAPAVSSMLGIRQTLLSAVLFDAPPICTPLVSDLVADYQGPGAGAGPSRDAYIIVLLPGESTLGKQPDRDLVLLPLAVAGNPVVSVVDVEGKVLELDMEWEAEARYYFCIREMCRFRVSEHGRTSSGHRISAANPVRRLDGMDHERCSALHNEILYKGWVGSGRRAEEFPSQTWWDYNAPPQDIINRLSPSLVSFLKQARFLPYGEYPDYSFFYFVGNLMNSEGLLSMAEFASYPYIDDDRFVFLYYATPYKTGDQQGIFFDQETSTAAFVGDLADITAMCQRGWGWKPLEVILDAYLEMIDEGKVFAALDSEASEECEMLYSFPPWRIRAFSDTDLEKAVTAMRRLLDAIETRLPAQRPPKEKKTLPWCDILDKEYLPTSSFAYQFLTRIAEWPVSIKYIAPGIYFPNKPDQQPYLSTQSEPEEPESMPLRIFHIDGHGRQSSSWTSLNKDSTVPAGALPQRNRAQNQHSFLRRMGIDPASEDPIPINQYSELYQSGFTGFTDLRAVQIWKVLQSWAERVEQGDWEVDGDGVAGGVERFHDADTEAHWRKYWIPPSW